MDTWGITNIRYNSNKTHLEKVKAGKIVKDNLSDQVILSRAEVVQKIKKGDNFKTLIKTQTGWNVGQEVQIIEVTTEYIKTKADKSERDNLENLPEF